MSSKKSGYQAHTAFTFTHKHGETSSYKPGDEVPEDVATHFFGAAHTTYTGDKSGKDEPDFASAVEAEVSRRIAQERERVEAEAVAMRERIAELEKAHPVADPVRDAEAEKKAAANAQTVATGDTVKGSTGDPKQAENDAKAQAEAAGKPTTGRRGS